MKSIIIIEFNIFEAKKFPDVFDQKVVDTYEFKIFLWQSVYYIIPRRGFRVATATRKCGQHTLIIKKGGVLSVLTDILLPRLKFDCAPLIPSVQYVYVIKKLVQRE